MIITSQKIRSDSTLLFTEEHESLLVLAPTNNAGLCFSFSCTYTPLTLKPCTASYLYDESSTRLL